MKKLKLPIKVISKKIPINKIPVNDVSNEHHPILKHYFAASQDFDFQFNRQLNSSIEDQVLITTLIFSMVLEHLQQKFF